MAKGNEISIEHPAYAQEWARHAFYKSKLTDASERTLDTKLQNTLWIVVVYVQYADHYTYNIDKTAGKYNKSIIHFDGTVLT